MAAPREEMREKMSQEKDKNEKTSSDDSKNDVAGAMCMLMAVLVVCMFAPMSTWLAEAGHLACSHALAFISAFASGALWMHGAKSSASRP